MSSNEEVEALRKTQLFGNIDPSKLKSIADRLERVDYIAGQDLFQFGDPPEAAQIIMEGEADIIVPTEEGEVVVAKIKRNDLVGEIGIVSGDIPCRTATLLANASLSALVITKDVLFRLMSEFPEINESIEKLVACMVFDTGRKRDRTMMGVTPEQAAEELTRYGADVVGANCGTGVEDFVAICASMASATHLPVWVKANAGLPAFDQGEVVYPFDPRQFAAYLPALLEAGAKFVGGCCGTSPDYIAALREKLGEPH